MKWREIIIQAHSPSFRAKLERCDANARIAQQESGTTNSAAACLRFKGPTRALWVLRYMGSGAVQ
jgi:hypothetical protein